MDLRSLGLSSYEEKAYKALIKLGKASASQISREGGISYGKIYEVLASLERKGLVRTVPEKTKMFVPSDPQNLAQLVDKKEKQLAQIKEEIAKLKQVYEIHEEEVVHMIKGRKNFYKLVRELGAPKKIKYTIKYTSEFHPEWSRDDRKLTKNGISVRSLARYDEETRSNVQKWLKVHSNIRAIENKGVAIDIRDHGVLISLIKNNISLLVKDQAFIDMMKTLFLNTYENAEKI